MDDLEMVIQGFGLAGVAVFVALATLNALFLVLTLIKHDRGVSMIPLIGGLSGFLGCLAIPSLRYYAVAPLLLDIGTAFPLIFGLPSVFRDIWQTCRYNLLKEYVGFDGKKTVRLRLFRHGIFTLLQERQVQGLGIARRSTIGGWFEVNGELRLRIGTEEAVYCVLDQDGQNALCQTIGFISYERSADSALAGIKFQLQYSVAED